MKKIILLVFIFSFNTRTILLAQILSLNPSLSSQTDTIFSVPYAQPAIVEYTIPILINETRVWTPTHGNSETSGPFHSQGFMSQTLSLPKPDNFFIAFSLNELINIINDNPDMFPRKIRFLIEKSSMQLKNIFVFQGDNYYQMDSFKIDSLAYSIMPNHHLHITSEGPSLLSKITSCYHQTFSVTNEVNGVQKQWFRSTGFSTDSSACKFTLDLSPSDTSLEVQSGKIYPTALTLQSSADFLQFTVSLEPTETELAIYNILGQKEFSEIVPPFTSTLILYSPVFPSGYYFARYNNKMIKFYYK
jgi:hypothetical protein